MYQLLVNTIVTYWQFSCLMRIFIINVKELIKMDDQLIVYYSRNSELKELEIGQIEKVALMIAKLTGASLFKLKVKSIC